MLRALGSSKDRKTKKQRDELMVTLSFANAKIQNLRFQLQQLNAKVNISFLHLFEALTPPLSLALPKKIIYLTNFSVKLAIIPFWLQVHECVRKSTLFHTQAGSQLNLDDFAEGDDDSPLPLIVLGLKETAHVDLKVR